MRQRDLIYPSDLPRMADFAHWGMAVAAAIGEHPSAFAAAYDANIGRQNAEVISAHVLATVLVPFIEQHGTWSGRATELLLELDRAAPAQHVDVKDRQWPKQANQLTRRLNELSATLENMGIKVNIRRGRQGSQLELHYARDDGDDGDDATECRHEHRHAQTDGRQ